MDKEFIILLADNISTLRTRISSDSSRTLLERNWIRSALPSIFCRLFKIRPLDYSRQEQAECGLDRCYSSSTVAPRSHPFPTGRPFSLSLMRPWWGLTLPQLSSSSSSFSFHLLDYSVYRCGRLFCSSRSSSSLRVIRLLLTSPWQHYSLTTRQTRRDNLSLLLLLLLKKDILEDALGWSFDERLIFGWKMIFFWWRYRIDHGGPSWLKARKLGSI